MLPLGLARTAQRSIDGCNGVIDTEIDPHQFRSAVRSACDADLPRLQFEHVSEQTNDCVIRPSIDRRAGNSNTEFICRHFHEG